MEQTSEVTRSRTIPRESTRIIPPENVEIGLDSPISESSRRDDCSSMKNHNMKQRILWLLLHQPILYIRESVLQQDLNSQQRKRYRTLKIIRLQKIYRTYQLPEHDVLIQEVNTSTLTKLLDEMEKFSKKRGTAKEFATDVISQNNGDVFSAKFPSER